MGLNRGGLREFRASERTHRLRKTSAVKRQVRSDHETQDPAEEVFIRLECFQCHAVKRERFPEPGKEPSGLGPELTGMGGHHPAEYFAESILNPNAVIIAGPGYTEADGLSIMPDYRESLTVAELIDLVAYCKSLTDMRDHGTSVKPSRRGQQHKHH
jgi:mono/diheme cytochrome c family protein